VTELAARMTLHTPGQITWPEPDLKKTCDQCQHFAPPPRTAPAAKVKGSAIWFAHTSTSPGERSTGPRPPLARSSEDDLMPLIAMPFSRITAEHLGIRSEPTSMCLCPRCGAGDLWPELAQGVDWAIYCRACGWIGPKVPADAEIDAAVAAWNAEGRKVEEARALGLKLCFIQPPAPAEETA